MLLKKIKINRTKSCATQNTLLYCVSIKRQKERLERADDRTSETHTHTSLYMGDKTCDHVCSLDAQEGNN